MLKLLFLIIGLAALVGMILHIGLTPILQTIANLGPWPLTVILLPMILVYGLEAFGWQLALGTQAHRVGFIRLFSIRMAGESVNVTTPTAYMGGEPLKAYLLKRYGIPMVDGLASVVTAKTTMTLAQVLFILLGLALTFGIIGDVERSWLALLVSLGVLVFGVGVFILLQRYGLGVGILTLLRACHIHLTFLETRQSQLEELDSTIRNFYSHHRGRFYLALGTFFTAWMAETLEVYAILYFLHVDVGVVASIAIAALTVFIKGGTFFIPGSLGAQEGGYTLLLMSFGYSEVTGLTFALIRRLREILWIVVGLVCLAALKGQDVFKSSTPHSSQ
ncbi:MAG: flippase-like domain-containing protein [Nitrospira sp.]|nr:flippase-like domain-containing protein [Nitrospira sp.]MCA9474977.1 flippase-like domain-containing protein [Nitrospira sp.]MCA9481126.1 flippase-like domain-containing protein [Nitrospira sp.]MDR4487825.1 flippase-like domain-containing protein [Nitrospirales bacterium]HQU28606.1 flippase-like domain-containing protein [Nitrospirales bacterium]